MRILVVTPSLSIHTGGLAILVPEVARALERRGVGVTILATNERHLPSYPHREHVGTEDVVPAAAGLDIRLYSVRTPTRFAFSPRLAREARALAIGSDLVHVHGRFLHPQLAGWRAARRARVPLVVSPHGALDPPSSQTAGSSGGGRLPGSSLQARAVQQAAAIHVGCEQELSTLAAVAPSVPRYVAPAGIDLATFEDLPSGTPFRRRYLRGFGGSVVLYMGRLVASRRIDLLIDACARRIDAGTDLRLVVAGPDEAGVGAELRQRVKAHGMGEKVVFTGTLAGREKLEALAAADVWARLSRDQRASSGVLEALAAGLPCLLSHQVPNGSELQEEGAALLVDLDADDVAAALGALLASPQRRARMAEAAWRCAERFDWDEVAPRWLEMYDRTITVG